MRVGKSNVQEGWMLALAGVVLLVALGIGLLLWIAVLPGLH